MVAITRLQSATTSTATALGSFPLLQYPQIITNRPCRLTGQDFKNYQYHRERRVIGNGKIKMRRRTNTIACGWLLPVDPWAPNMSIDSQSIASLLFALSLFPYLGFLFFITKSNSAPKLTLFGFYFLLAFVGATSKFLHPFVFFFFPNDVPPVNLIIELVPVQVSVPKDFESLTLSY